MRRLHRGRNLLLGWDCAISRHARRWGLLILLLFSVNIDHPYLQQKSDIEAVDIELLKHWNRKAAYDSIMMYLSPLYEVWTENRHFELLSQSFKYYISALYYEEGVSLPDTFDKYEQLILEHQGEPLFLNFIYAQEALYNLYYGYTDQTIQILESICQVGELEHFYPELLSESLNLLSYIYVFERKLDEAIMLNQKADDILIKEFGEDYSGRVTVYNNYAFIYDELGQLDKSVKYAELTKNLVFKHYGETHENRAITLNNLATKYADIGLFSEANDILDEAIRLNTLANRPTELIMNYYNKSYNYSKYFDYDNTIKMLTLAESLMDNTPDVSDGMKIRVYISLVSQLNDLGKYESANAYLQKAIAVSNRTEENIDANIINLYALRRTHEDAKDNHQEALQYARLYTLSAKEWYGDQHPKIAHGWHWMAESFEELGVLDSALYYADLAQEMYKALVGPRHFHTIENNLYRANLHLEHLEQDSAKAIIDRELLAGVSPDSSFAENIPPYELIDKHPHLIRLLELKIKQLSLADHISPEEKLTYQIQLYEYIDQEFNRLIKVYGGLKDREDLQSRSENIFKKAMLLCYEYYNLSSDDQWAEKAFEFSQKARALKIQEIMRDRLARQDINIPDSLSKTEVALKTKVNSIYDLLSETSQEDSTVYLSIKNEYLNAKAEYDVFIKKLESNYPAYYDLKFNLEHATVADVQKTLLDKKHTMVQYTWLDTMLLIHVVRKDDLHFVRVDIDKQLERLTLDWYLKMQNIDMNNVDSLGHILYTYLIQPIEPLLITHELIIIPDNILYYVNFEALPTPGEENIRQSYVIHNHLIQYSYSPTVSLQISKYNKRRQYDLSWLGLVPGFKDHSNLPKELNDKNKYAHQPFALETSRRISQLMNGTLLEGHEATIENLKKYCSSTKVLHFATHAVANDNDPLSSFLVLYGEDNTSELLSADKIFNMDFKSKCTVLTACETAVGQIKAGEGMVSLARAFAYAGSPNLVMTLWPVDEENTNVIIEAFYNHLNNGLTVDQALHQAKLEFISTAKGELKHPFYWSGIVYYGTETTIVRRLSKPLLWAGGIMILALAGLGVYRMQNIGI